MNQYRKNKLAPLMMCSRDLTGFWFKPKGNLYIERGKGITVVGTGVSLLENTGVMQ